MAVGFSPLCGDNEHKPQLMEMKDVCPAVLLVFVWG